MAEHCTDCGKILRGRSDKRFCDDYCRSHHYNQVHRDDNTFTKQINRILKKNRSILKGLHTQGKLMATRQSLLVLGFDFSFYTHQEEHEKSDPYTFCYEYGYLKLNEEEYAVYKK